jgi:hypothetical protein
MCVLTIPTYSQRNAGQSWVPTGPTLYVNCLVMSTHFHPCLLLLIKMSLAILCGMRSLLCSHQAVGYHTRLPIWAQAGQHRLWREGLVAPWLD